MKLLIVYHPLVQKLFSCHSLDYWYHNLSEKTHIIKIMKEPSITEAGYHNNSKESYDLGIIHQSNFSFLVNFELLRISWPYQLSKKVHVDGTLVIGTGSHQQVQKFLEFYAWFRKSIAYRKLSLRTKYNTNSEKLKKIYSLEIL